MHVPSISKESYLWASCQAFPSLTCLKRSKHEDSLEMNEHVSTCIPFISYISCISCITGVQSWEFLCRLGFLFRITVVISYRSVFGDLMGQLRGDQFEIKIQSWGFLIQTWYSLHSQTWLTTVVCSEISFGTILWGFDWEEVQLGLFMQTCKLWPMLKDS